MTKTKTILFLLAASLVIMAALGVTYAQYVNAQTTGTNNYTSQTPAQGYNNGNYGYCPPNHVNGYPQQGSYPYRMGMGMGMYGRDW